MRLNSAARSKYTEWPALGTLTWRPFGAKLARPGPAGDGNTESSSPLRNSTGIGSFARGPWARRRVRPPPSGGANAALADPNPRWAPRRAGGTLVPGKGGRSPALLQPAGRLVFHDTKVIPARLVGRYDLGVVEDQ